jgi:CarD family transcriptional regulator
MGFEKDVTYYIMKSIFEKETFYIPVDHVDSLRQPLTKEDALNLIDSLPLLEPLQNPKDEDYRETIRHYDCYSYAKIVKSVHDKNTHNLAIGKKLSSVDNKYYRTAEKYLYEELAFALDIPTNEVEEYIKSRLTPVR